ncbi:adenylosuccinate lyase [Rhodococcus opacus PD630]|uniref:class-II fumarase/aspartase family protein n=1 Tax=Rhodococcus opacus TaxID=37919 RepID=UPI00029CD27D|nr:adenylosuccinate lyase family protein [Rhodococcus opacus]AHK35119.1 Adenylosuccinate lyase [Rhodococcus opacus PD630]EHI41608.1 adenylosuccinate lyase [Rhodococcus opacus PD630]RYE40428.1 MAG: adenylosuccinate lyase family protein [Hyphomicrobiales bacterium]UDG97165.1 adenylosuccinate lyase family protein [Rhodococcus opacus PD630]
MKKRFTSARVPGTGMEQLFSTPARWQAWLDVEAALARAQADLGLIPADAGKAITRACDLDRLDQDRINTEIDRTSHPLMPLIVELARAAGDDGGWVHWGATTQNITQTGDTLLLRRAHTIIRGQITDILTVLADLTERGAEMIMAGRTHGQHAVPITFGFKTAGWIDEYVRHLDRLDQISPRLFVALLGGAAGTSASLGEDPDTLQRAVATNLGLTPMAVPSRSISDHFAEFVTVLGLIATTSGKIAREIYQLMKTEYHEVEEPVPAGTVGSSTMPHKRNPQLCQDIIGMTAEIRALVPLALESAISEHDADNAPSALFDVEQHACELTADTLARIHLIVSGLQLDPRRMRSNLDLSGGMIASEAIMLRLGETIGRQLAHEVVYDAAQTASTTATSFTDALAVDPRVTSQLDTDTIKNLLQPDSHLGLAPAIAHHQAIRAREIVVSRREN